MRSTTYSISTRNAFQGLQSDVQPATALAPALILQIRWQHIGVAVGRPADFGAGRTCAPDIHHTLSAADNISLSSCMLLHVDAGGPSVGLKADDIRAVTCMRAVRMCVR